jgi:hypothetical protein
MKTFNDFIDEKKSNEAKKLDSSEPQNEALGVMSFKIRKGIGDLLHSFGFGREDEDYKEMYIELEEKIKELLRDHGVIIVDQDI